MAYNPGDTFSFGIPCLKAKQILAYKRQGGIPGFAAPYYTRYLNCQITVVVTWRNGYGPSEPTTSVYTVAFDRISGDVSSSSPPAEFHTNYNWYSGFAFPYNQTLNDQWVVSDTQYVYTAYLNNDGSTTPGSPILVRTTVTTVTLSNPYTLAQLDADCQALIDGVIAQGLNWGQLVIAPNEDDPTLDAFNGDETGAFPANVLFNKDSNTVTLPISTVAWNFWQAGEVGGDVLDSNFYGKLVSILAIAGNYCLKTYVLEYATKNQLSETCQQVTGSCAGSFTVQPTDYTPTQTNSYTVIVANCRCSG